MRRLFAVSAVIAVCGYEVAGDTFRLNYPVKGEKDPRSAAFATSAKTDESLIVLRRENK